MSSVIARRYAQALMNLAVRDKALDAVAAGLDEIADAAAASTELRHFLADPQVSVGNKGQVLDELVTRAEVPKLVANFVRLVNAKRRASLLAQMRDEFHRLADERQGRAHVQVTVASELEPAQREALQRQLEALSGKQLTVHMKVDPAILGGIVARIGSTVWDGSLRHQLTQIHHSITKG